MNRGPYCRIATAITRSTISAAAEVAGSEQDPPEVDCTSGPADIESFHKVTGVSSKMRLKIDSTETVKVWNHWPEAIDTGSRVVIAQLADGAWIVLAEACNA